MNNFNHTRENALGVIHSPPLRKLILLCSAYLSQEIHLQVSLEPLLACVWRWLRSPQGPCLPWSSQGCESTCLVGRHAPDQPQRSRAYDIGRCSDFCPLCGAPQKSKYLQLHFTNCGCGDTFPISRFYWPHIYPHHWLEVSWFLSVDIFGWRRMI